MLKCDKCGKEMTENKDHLVGGGFVDGKMEYAGCTYCVKNYDGYLSDVSSTIEVFDDGCGGKIKMTEAFRRDCEHRKPDLVTGEVYQYGKRLD